MIKNCFYDYHKNKQKHILHFELPFFMINLYVNTSNYLHIEKFTSHKHYLFGLLLSGRPKETHTDQSTLHLFYSVWKETTHKPPKVATAKNIFSSVYVIGGVYINKCFLFHVITGRHSLLLTVGSFLPPRPGFHEFLICFLSFCN